MVRSGVVKGDVSFPGEYVSQVESLLSETNHRDLQDLLQRACILRAQHQDTG